MASDGRGTKLNKGPRKPLCAKCGDSGLVLTAKRTGPRRKGWEYGWNTPCTKCAAGKKKREEAAGHEQA